MTAGFELPVDSCHGEPCRRYGPGHRMHHIHARRIAKSPWGWRDGLVTAVRGNVVQVAYLDGTATPLAWHHADLTEVLRPGEPVRLHERYHALGCPLGWFNMVIAGGLGTGSGRSGRLA